MPKLHDLQRGIRIAVLGGDAGAIRDAILSDGLPAEARLQIHRNHVWTTLTDALKATFPVVCRLVDERFFAFAANTYIQSHPPSSPCLVEYGESFPGFLEAFPPCRTLPYLADVARLEWTLNTALHAGEEPPALATALMQVRAADQPHLILRLQPSLRLLASPWPVDRIWAANQPDADPDETIDISTGGVQIEVRRRGNSVAFRRLAAPPFAFRQALARRQTLESAAVAALAVDPSFDLATALADLLGDGAIAGFSVIPSLTEEHRP
jgi:hypothetical protein